MLKEIEFGDALVTITRVETSADLSVSKIFLSILPEENSQYVLTRTNKNIFEIQRILNKRLEMKSVPQIKFLPDKISEKAERVQKLLNKIKANRE